MMASAELIRTHLDYTSWASGRLLTAASQLNPTELTRDFGTADKSVLGTLTHIFAAERAWFARIQGTPRKAFVEPEDRDLGVLEREWPALLDRWKTWAAELTDALLNEKCSYQDYAGTPHRTPLWQIVLHVVNHGTHHRGQVSGFLRALGTVPPPLDLIFYYREKIHGETLPRS